MRTSNWLKALLTLGLEFWLPLPLLGLLFWVGGDWVSDWAMGQPYTTGVQLQSSTQLQVEVPVSIVSIEVEVRRDQGFSKVEVKTANPNLKKLEYEFAVLEFGRLEAAISKELGLSPERVQPLIRYEIKR